MARNLIAAAALLCWLGSLAAPAALAYPKLEIQGDSPLNGIFDPSVEYAPGAAVGWLAYSAVFGPLQPWGPHVETRLAQSLDGGASWSFVGVVSPSLRQAVVLPDGSTRDAVLNSEVPCLVYDADDPGREWKLFTHRIFRLWVDQFQTEQSLPAQSWIAYRTAPQPTGPWSQEIALFGSDFGGGQSDYHEGNSAGGLLMPQLRLTQYPELFQVFSTGERIVSPAALPPLSIAGRAVVAGLLQLVAVRRQRRRSRCPLPECERTG